MKQINLKLVGGPRVTVLADGEQLLFTPTRKEWPEPPQLLDGLRADHVSFPLKPRLHGPHAGKLWVHLTYNLPNGGVVRKEVAAIDPEHLRRGIEHFQKGMGELFLAATIRDVTLEALEAEKLKVWLPKPSLFALFDEVFSNPRHTYELSETSFDSLIDHMELGSPLDIRQPQYDKCRHFVACDPECGFRLSLNRPEPGSEDWWATPDPWHTTEQFVALMGEAFPTLWDHLYVVGRELQADMDRERLLTVMTGS